MISAAPRDSWLRKRGGEISDLYWLSDAQMAKLEPVFPKSHGEPRVDDRRVLSGIIFINRNGLCWRDAPAEYGRHKTLYSRLKRWSENGSDPLRQVPEGLPVRMRFDCRRHVLAMNPDPSEECVKVDGGKLSQLAAAQRFWEDLG